MQSTDPENCFHNAEAFTLSSLPALKTVTIGNFAFSNVKGFRIGYANQAGEGGVREGCVHELQAAVREQWEWDVRLSGRREPFRMKNNNSLTSFANATVLFNESAGNEAPWIDDIRKKVLRKKGYV